MQQVIAFDPEIDNLAAQAKGVFPATAARSEVLAERAKSCGETMKAMVSDTEVDPN